MSSLIQSIIDRQNRLVSVTKSEHGFAVPPFSRNYAIVTKRGGLAYNDSESGVSDVNQCKMAAKFIISTTTPDRSGDIVIPAGCMPTLDRYKKNSLVCFGHQQVASVVFPIGSATSPQGEFSLEINETNIQSWCYFHGLTPESNIIFHLVANKQLNGASIGFNPIEAQRLPSRKDASYYEMDGGPNNRAVNSVPGWLFKLWELLEWSICSLQDNSEAIAIGISKGIINGDRVSPTLAKCLKPYAASMSGAVRSGYDGKGIVLKGINKIPLTQSPREMNYREPEQFLPYPYGVWNPKNEIRLKQRPLQNVDTVWHDRVLTLKSPDRSKIWAKQLQSARFKGGPRPHHFDQAGVKAPFEAERAFDIAEEAEIPLTRMIDWVAKYLQVPVKKVFQTSIFVPSVRMGTFLTGLGLTLTQKQYEQEDVRQLAYNGGEMPPNYESIRLNSKSTNTFLVSGSGFYRGPTQLVIDYQRQWGGIDLTFYCQLEKSAEAESIINATREWAETNNFLRGEKFTLMGDFLEKTNEDWGDLFLEETNIKTVRRVLDRFNDKGMAFANNGSILSGPPGTGKTLTARIVLNKASGTYIWVSARDFYSYGSHSAMTSAYDLAKELSPSVVVFEDIDAWVSEKNIDFLKSEMDGVARYSGVWTIITTNFPERLPAALIDRPGRFHDVLQFALPTQEARKMMLLKWAPGISQTALLKAVADTNDYSGAHLYHLAAFAKSLQESEGIDIDQAVGLAVQKVREQKELITGIQLEGSSFRPRKAFLDIVTKGGRHG